MNTKKWYIFVRVGQMMSNSDSQIVWDICLSTKADKQIKQLEKERPKIYAAAYVLIREIEKKGPWRNNWPNYGLLKGKGGSDNLHCHLNKKGRPTYVACWRIEDKKIKIVEVYYVGTHEKAPY